MKLVEVVLKARLTMIASALLMSAGCAPVAAPKQNIGEMIAHARTASDYDAIADYYDQEATNAKAKYEEHHASAVRYEGVAKWRTWSWHCDRLAQDFNDAEQEAYALAAEHRKIAEEMKSGQTSVGSATSTQTAKPNM